MFESISGAALLLVLFSTLLHPDVRTKVSDTATSLGIWGPVEYIRMPVMEPAAREKAIAKLEERAGKSQGGGSPQQVNREAFAAIIECLQQDELFEPGVPRRELRAEYERCARVLKISIMQSDYCTGHVEGIMRGEDVACGSYQHSMRRLGYTFILERYPSMVADLYEALTEALVHHIFAQIEQIKPLIETGIAANRSLIGTYATINATQPAVIPVDRLILTDWWGLRDYDDGGRRIHPLGTYWWATPYDIPGHFFLGYSIEKLCGLEPAIPLHERKNGVALLAKNREYLFPQSEIPFNAEDLVKVEEMLNITIDSYIGDHSDSVHGHDPDNLPPGLNNHGKLPAAEYREALRNSLALLGEGKPGSSPTPYLAICEGVPFINPHFKDAPPVEEWYQTNNIFQRQTYQHGPLAFYGPPYVYNVAYRDADGLYEALKSALENPIERHIMPEVTDAANDERVRRLFARDLRAEAAEIYAADAATEVVMEELIDA